MGPLDRTSASAGAAIPLTASSPSPGEPPLVDRVDELAVLTASLDALAEHANGASVVILEGAAGIGKSRLLAASIALGGERGVRIATARARQAEQDFSFGVVLQLLETTIATLPPDQRHAVFSGSAALARPLFEGQSDASLPAPARLRHGLYWLVVNLAQQAPLLLSVDDLHWSDEPSLQFLGYLAERIEGSAVMMLAATRPPRSFTESQALISLLAVPGVTRLRLRALTVAGVAAVVRARLGSADDQICQACAEVTKGNPFYLQETLRSIGDEQFAPTDSAANRLQQLGAASIARASLFRVLRLGPPAIALVHAFAVLGDQTPLRLAAALADLDLASAAVAADLAISEGILRGQDGIFDFTHPLIGESIAAEVSPTRRGLAHRSAAQLLHEDNGLPEVAAAHLLAAPAGGEQWAADVLREAAHRASQLGAPGTATRFLRRALDENPASADRATLLTELGQAETAAAVGEPIEHLSAALRLETDPDQRLQISRLIARALVATGDRRAAARILDAALDDCARSGSALHDGLMLDYLATCMFEAGLRQTALERVTALRTGSPAATSAESRASLAILAMRAGQDARPSEAIALADQAWSDGQLLVDSGPDDAPWLMVTWACALAEDYARVTAMCSAAVAAAQRDGSANAFVTASYFLGFGWFRQGQLAAAAADLDLALQPVGVEGNPYRHAIFGLRALVFLELDDIDSAQVALDSAAATTAKLHDDVFERAFTLHAGARVLAARGQHAAALESFLAVGEQLTQHLSVDHTVIPWRFHGALAALQSGDAALAGQLVAPMLEQAQGAGLRLNEARSLRILGLADSGPKGIALLRQACGVYATTQACLEHAYAIADLGVALRRAGHRSEATSHLRVALDLATRLNATRLSAHLRGDLVSSGARPRRDAIRGPESLTPTERRVAGLVAQGLTNLQTAQSLFVTPKTIEYHLLHIYRKLDIQRRTQLAAALAVAGLSH